MLCVDKLNRQWRLKYRSVFISFEGSCFHKRKSWNKWLLLRILPVFLFVVRRSVTLGCEKKTKGVGDRASERKSDRHTNRQTDRGKQERLGQNHSQYLWDSGVVVQGQAYFLKRFGNCFVSLTSSQLWRSHNNAAALCAIHERHRRVIAVRRWCTEGVVKIFMS